MDHTDPPGMPEDERMKGVELKMVREWLALSGQELADLLGVNARTVRSWEQGRDPIPDSVRLEVERMEAVTAQAVTAGVEALMDLPEPTVLTYLNDGQYREREPDSTWPASWHRRVVARIAQEVPGLAIVSPEETQQENR
ncbi:DUF1870 family protein [Nocardiopsis eucommiae]|uniref:DUF1870 family protein n=1 Tax=Nocardiopsis eucommiae TaxID=2831970 RepID=A0A975LCR7_9ACTN|nr:DUF1870 family protein [Nocardiopsis eucommiae]